MSTRVRKRVRAPYDQRSTGLRKDVQEAIDRVWPDGIVEMSLDPGESYFFDVHPKLSRAFRRITNTQIVYERAGWAPRSASSTSIGPRTRMAN
jgi:hypothetical protein